MRLGLQGEVYQCDSTLQGAYEVTQRIMRERPATDGIIYVVDLLAASGVRALVDLGFTVISYHEPFHPSYSRSSVLG
ncbi:MAG: hypothetical protein QM373_00005 [Bacillota bacterium]|nr:hypothetical protein [Bacillota bacterium]